ncbi:pRL2-8 [Streptomyces sp. A1547]|uniref:pRL2-8 n=1 Tax=Streptomyces sp. A1547 TaxID=2563105 RepID=UPI00109E5CEF|nr:pRL2-8 [Streptomyces sp. A1547]THA28462.1 pRL2-8 [Streptomyces sp. A1547]
MAASEKALNPPRGECRQCWFHAYASREAHASLGPREDCPDCVAHMVHGHPDNLIVR